jgi:hypothetical protein
MKLRATVSFAASMLFISACSGGASQSNQTNSNNNTQTGSRPDIYGNYTNVTAGGSTETRPPVDSGNVSSAMNVNAYRPPEPSSSAINQMNDKDQASYNHSSRGPRATPPPTNTLPKIYQGNVSSRAVETNTSSRSSEANVTPHNRNTNHNANRSTVMEVNRKP